MALHIWSILCHKALVDKDTNQVSLLDVIESLNIEVTVEPGQPVGEATFAIPASLQLATFWTRSDPNTPEKSLAKVTFYSPSQAADGSSLFELDLLNFTNTRSIIKIPGISVAENGRYWFMVELERSNQWFEVARIPLDISIKIIALERPQA
jgi:hypothetical protein